MAHRFQTVAVVDTADGRLVAGSGVVVDGIRYRVKTRVNMCGCGWKSTRAIYRITAALAEAGWRPYWADRLMISRDGRGGFTISAIEIAEASLTPAERQP